MAMRHQPPAVLASAAPAPRHASIAMYMYSHSKPGMRMFWPKALALELTSHIMRPAAGIYAPGVSDVGSWHCGRGHNCLAALEHIHHRELLWPIKKAPRPGGHAAGLCIGQAVQRKKMWYMYSLDKELTGKYTTNPGLLTGTLIDHWLVHGASALHHNLAMQALTFPQLPHQLRIKETVPGGKGKWVQVWNARERG